jgi:hypothetical protein
MFERSARFGRNIDLNEKTAVFKVAARIAGDGVVPDRTSGRSLSTEQLE